MKIKLLKTSLIILLGIVGFVCVNSTKDRQFSSLTFIEECKTLNDNKFDIGIIGDSWVASKKIEIGLQSKLFSVENLKVTSFGQGGAKSKKIFENLYQKRNDKFSSKLVLKGGYDAIIIIAGVNDIGSHIGKDFYSFHMMKIIEQLDRCNILPIVVTIPEFGVEESFAERPLHKKILKDIPNRIIFDYNITNPREKYSEELRSQLSLSHIKYLAIEFDDFIADYQKSINLYANHSHLNSEGYVKFGEFIGSKILENMKFVNENTVANIR